METAALYIATAPTTGTPAYKSIAYRAKAPVWGFLRDVYEGSEAWLGRDEAGNIHPTTKAKTYLPQEAGEDKEAYLARIARSPFDDRFAQSIRKFVGLILANPVKADVTSQVLEHFLHLGADGSSFGQLMRRIAIAAIRDGHTFVLVDYPDSSNIRSQADYLAAKLQPTWALYSALDVVSYVTVQDQGRVVPVMVTLREAAIASGLFQEEAVTRYRVLTPGAWALHEERKDGKGKLHYPLVAAGTFSFKTIPLVCIYGGLKTGFYESEPSLKSLADLNLVHYQVKSDHLRKLHLCCLPVPVLVDSMRSDDEPLTIGPNTFLHVKDPGGSFSWSEPIATSIEQSRREVLDLETTMDFLSASYLENPSDRQAALTTSVQTKQVEASLVGVASSLSEGINECLALHGAYLGVDGGKVEFSGEILVERGADSQMMLAYTNLMVAIASLPPNLSLFLLQLLSSLGYFPEGLELPK
jgi:hypothetical protein